MDPLGPFYKGIWGHCRPMQGVGSLILGPLGLLWVSETYRVTIQGVRGLLMACPGELRPIYTRVYPGGQEAHIKPIQRLGRPLLRPFQGVEACLGPILSIGQAVKAVGRHSLNMNTKEKRSMM